MRIFPPTGSPMLTLLALLAGCSPDALPDGGDSGGDIADSGGGDSGAGGDSGDEIPGAPDVFERVTVRLAVNMPTVAIVEWALSGAVDDVWVEVGASTTYDRVVLPDPDEPMSAEIVGMTPGETLHLRVVARVGDEQVATDDVTVTAGVVGEDAPSATIDDTQPADAFGVGVMYTWFDAGTARGGVTLVDRSGRPMWSLPAVDGMIPVARPSRDGHSLVYLRQDIRPDGFASEICRVSFSLERKECVTVPGAHHDFAELPARGFVYLRSTEEAYGAYTLIGDELVERSGNGDEQVLWRVSDDFAPEYTATWDQTPSHVDWIHANGLWWDQPSDTWYVSSFTQKAVFAVAGDGSGLEWQLGGPHSDFAISGSFGPQHAPQLVGDQLLMFDNTEHDPSRVVGFQIDEAQRTAREGLVLRDPEQTHAIVLGDAHRMPSGYYATGWGDVGRVLVFNPAGDMVWRLSLPAGILVGEVHAFTNLDALTPS